MIGQKNIINLINFIQKKINRLIVIAGPTAGGKTALAVELAKALDTEIISCDSRQFYHELSIGTAKPDEFEQSGVQHHMINSHQLEDEVNASTFEEEASLILKNLFKTHDDVILTGGSGMFIDALCFGLDNLPVDTLIHEQIEENYARYGLDFIVQELLKLDPDAKDVVELKNPRRVIRALEICQVSGKKLSELRQGFQRNNDFEAIFFIIEHDRENLYKRINERVDAMIKNGLVEEARSVYAKRHLKSLNTVGYKELFDYFDGNTTIEKAIELIKQNTRRYAKRQITWFKKYENAHRIKYQQNEIMLSEILGLLHNKSL